MMEMALQQLAKHKAEKKLSKFSSYGQHIAQLMEEMEYSQRKEFVRVVNAAAYMAQGGLLSPEINPR